MFTIDQIKAAHALVKTGADFPKYTRDLISLGVLAYDVYVKDGYAVYSGKDDYRVHSVAAYPVQTVAAKSDRKRFTQYLKMHQRGQTDYPTFCRHSAETGVEKWTVDMQQLTCTYYDQAGNVLLVEKIPV